MTTSRLNELDEAIKIAKGDEVKKKAALKRAKANLSKAENKTYQLQNLRDLLYVNSLGDKVDWDMVFNYNEDETAAAMDYRKHVAQNYYIKKSGHYNPETKQHVFCVEFQSDSKQELQAKIKTIDFVFSKLIPNPSDENRKCILIYNLIEVDDFDTYELAHKSSDGEYSILIRRLGRTSLHQSFKSLDEALNFIQSKSNVAFDAMLPDHPLLTVNT